MSLIERLQQLDLNEQMTRRSAAKTVAEGVVAVVGTGVVLSGIEGCDTSGVANMSFEQYREEKIPPGHKVTLTVKNPEKDLSGSVIMRVHNQQEIGENQDTQEEDWDLRGYLVTIVNAHGKDFPGRHKVYDRVVHSEELANLSPEDGFLAQNVLSESAENPDSVIHTVGWMVTFKAVREHDQGSPLDPATAGPGEIILVG